MDRVFLDANVLFSAAYKAVSPLRKLWELPDAELVTSFYALEEARRNLAIDKPEQLDCLEHLLDAMTVVADPSPQSALPEEVCLEEKDRPLLLAAIEAAATHFLTGDKEHFREYFGKTISGVLICRPRDYLNVRMKSGEAPSP